MRGVTAIAYHADHYLDARLPHWAEFERLGYVRVHRYGDGWVVTAHVNAGEAMFEALRERLREHRAAQTERNPIGKVGDHLDEIKKQIDPPRLP